VGGKKERKKVRPRQTKLKKKGGKKKKISSSFSESFYRWETSIMIQTVEKRPQKKTIALRQCCFWHEKQECAF